MKYKKALLAFACLSSPLFAESDQKLLQEIQNLQQQTQRLQSQLQHLQKKLIAHQKPHQDKTFAKTSASHGSSEQVAGGQGLARKHEHPITGQHLTKVKPQDRKKQQTRLSHKKNQGPYHSSPITVHAPELHPESIGFYPTALVAENKVVTYIAGTPVVSSPYLGDRPAFDGSDYIVNISSINRDLRLMQQRRRLYQAYQSIGYPIPPMPIIAISGKSEPVGMVNSPFRGGLDGDLTLGSSELDVAAALNQNVEAYIAVAYDASPPPVGPRIDNSAFNLNMGFVNIGNLDKSPLYFTAGQLYVPFGRYSSSMISAPLTMNLARTKTRPFIFGYKSQEEVGPFAAVYVYRSDTTLGKSGVGGVNLGYVYQYRTLKGELGASYIDSINDAAGMQSTRSTAGTTFGGFGSFTNGNEFVRKTQAMDVHANLTYDRFNLAGEWVGTTQHFRPQDLSYNAQGAKPQAAHTELDMTFIAFDRPASLGVGYQWSKEALALNLPQHRFIGVFNISIWKDTVESLEYRHDLDYNLYQFANGAAPFGQVNATTFGTGRSADTLSAQIGVYF